MDRTAISTAQERAQLFKAVEPRHTHRIHAAIIEKDFWVCWTLHRIFEVMHFRPHLIFIKNQGQPFKNQGLRTRVNP